VRETCQASVLRAFTLFFKAVRRVHYLNLMDTRLWNLSYPKLRVWSVIVIQVWQMVWGIDVMETLTTTFLGDRSAWRDALLVLDDLRGAWGGKRITVRGNGSTVIKVVDLSGNEEVYAFSLSIEQTDALFEQCITADVLSVSTGPADEQQGGEAATTLSITNAAGEQASVTQQVRDASDPRFEAARSALESLYDAMGELGATVVSMQPVQASGARQVRAADNGIQRDPTRVLEGLMEFFREDEWAFEKLPDRPLLRLPFQGHNGKWNCYAQVRMTKDLEQILFYSVAPLTIPEESRPAVAEFITRANYAMALGNFEMDFSDGEVRFKTSIDVTNVEVVPGLIRPVVYTNCLMMEKYLPGLMSVIYTHVSPEEAVRQIEGA
jgi:hypothetical protein